MAASLPRPLPPGLLGAVSELRRRFGETAVHVGMGQAVGAFPEGETVVPGEARTGGEPGKAEAVPGLPVWPTGIPALDGLTSLGGLPRGRLVLLVAGTSGATGRLTLLQALGAMASRSMPVAYVDLAGSLDPGFLADLGADLDAWVVVRPPQLALHAGLTMARILVAAGVPWLGVGLGRRCPVGAAAAVAAAATALAAAVSGAEAVACLSLPARGPRAVARVAALTLTCRSQGWQEAHGDVVGLRVGLEVTASRVAVPGAPATLLLRYPRPYAAAGVVGFPTVVPDGGGAGEGAGGAAGAAEPLGYGEGVSRRAGETVAG